MVVRIGTSGWSYDHWTSVLYPPGLSSGARLACYAHEFDTVELNGSFYRWPTDAIFSRWTEQVPANFGITVKAHRGLTHFRRLGSPESWVARIHRGWELLGERQKVLLVQLHPDQQRDDDRLQHFLDVMGPVGVAVELRHPSWDDPVVYDILRHHGAAYVVTSGARLPCVLQATSSLVYVRMHGPDPDELYRGSYSDEDLHWWAARIDEWRQAHRDVLVYFNNDEHGHAVRNARTLRQLVDG